MTIPLSTNKHWDNLVTSMKEVAKEANLDDAIEKLARQIDAAGDLKADQADDGPLLRSFRGSEKKDLKDTLPRVKKAQAVEKPKILQAKEAIEKEAENFCGQRQTPGQSPRRLANLRSKLNDKLAAKEKMSAAKILEMVEEEYGEDAEPGLIFEALEFLFLTTRDTTSSDKDLADMNKEIQKARTDYVKDKDTARRVVIAQTFRAQTKEIVDLGYGSAKEVRELIDTAINCETPSEVYNKIIPEGTPIKQAILILKNFNNTNAAKINTEGTSVDRAELADKVHKMRRSSAIILDTNRLFEKCKSQALKEEEAATAA